MHYTSASRGVALDSSFFRNFHIEEARPHPDVVVEMVRLRKQAPVEINLPRFETRNRLQFVSHNIQNYSTNSECIAASHHFLNADFYFLQETHCYIGNTFHHMTVSEIPGHPTTLWARG
jgi:hypothetical protein